MKKTPFLIIGGGPAGLSCAIQAASLGQHVTIVERSHTLGGQLVKQTHKFFGSEKQYASVRGYKIAEKLIQEYIKLQDKIEVLLDATVTGLYPDKVCTVVQNEVYFKIQASVIVVATGASEKFIAFENNDLPGIYGAGAVQTLMNQYGVLPGNKIIMVGSGNIGLIVSYQLMQAGVKVVSVLEAAPSIGGYLVHASKLRRLGVPILTGKTILRASGTDCVESVEIVDLDESWNPIPGTEQIIEVDAVCVSVGLSPMHQLLSMAGAKIVYIAELGGWVPQVSTHHETTMEGIFACGDLSGVEEASSAMVEGRLAGLFATKKLLKSVDGFDQIYQDLKSQLDGLRSGPFGYKTRVGLLQMKEEESC